MKAPTVKTSPIMEIVARKLFGISSVPKEEQSKMVRSCAKAVYQYHEEKLNELKEIIEAQDLMIDNYRQKLRTKGGK